MYSGTVAIPTIDASGLQAKRSAHFGHSPYFTLVAMDQDRIQTIQAIANKGHGPGGCMTVVQLLQEQQVDTVIAAGMGNGPYTKLTVAGITVIFAEVGMYPDVESLVGGMQSLRLQPLLEQQLCRGNGDCHQSNSSPGRYR